MYFAFNPFTSVCNLISLTFMLNRVDFEGNGVVIQALGVFDNDT